MKQNYLLGRYWLEVNLADLSSFDAVLADLLVQTPAEHLPLVSQCLQAAPHYSVHLGVVRQYLFDIVTCLVQSLLMTDFWWRGIVLEVF